MIKPDWSKEKYIPSGIITEDVYRKDLTEGDSVVVLGEIFIVHANAYSGAIGLIELKHETDSDTTINETYVHHEGKGMVKKVCKRL